MLSKTRTPEAGQAKIIIAAIFVMPAKAGIQAFDVCHRSRWIPACAGMTMS